MHQKEAQLIAAEKAVELIPHNADYVVFGSGVLVHEALSAFMRKKLHHRVVCSSVSAEAHAKLLGMEVHDIKKANEQSAYIDSADQVDSHGNILKGAEGFDARAIYREKQLTHRVGHYIAIVQHDCLAGELGEGGMRIPIEYHPLYEKEVLKYLLGFTKNIRKRLGHDGRPFVTENKNHLFDIHMQGFDPVEMEIEFNSAHHVFSNGIFAVRKPDRLVVAYPDKVTVK